jgi:carbon monoxide dehydrogenase subunit G
MEMTNSFIVPVPPEEAWPVLLDLERIAPMLPGAMITSRDGDDYEGKAKIKVGPITAEYVGVARFVEVDEAGRRAVIEARAKDARGQGNMTATITAHLEPHESGATVIVDTNLDITGKIAQFGRGVINEAASAILAIFAARLAEEITSGGTGAETQTTSNAQSGTTPTNATSAPRAAQAEPEALDLIKLAKDARSGQGRPDVQWAPALVSIVAALVAVFAAGFASGRNKTS